MVMTVSSVGLKWFTFAKWTYVILWNACHLCNEHDTKYFALLGLWWMLSTIVWCLYISSEWASKQCLFMVLYWQLKQIVYYYRGKLEWNAGKICCTILIPPDAIQYTKVYIISGWLIIPKTSDILMSLLTFFSIQEKRLGWADEKQRESRLLEGPSKEEILERRTNIAPVDNAMVQIVGWWWRMDLAMKRRDQSLLLVGHRGGCCWRSWKDLAAACSSNWVTGASSSQCVLSEGPNKVRIFVQDECTWIPLLQSRM